MLTFSAVQDNDKIVGDLTKWLDPLEEVMCSPLGMNMACAWLGQWLWERPGPVWGRPHSYASGKSLGCRPVLG